MNIVDQVMSLISSTELTDLASKFGISEAQALGGVQAAVERLEEIVRSRMGDMKFIGQLGDAFRASSPTSALTLLAGDRAAEVSEAATAAVGSASAGPDLAEHAASAAYQFLSDQDDKLGGIARVAGLFGIGSLAGGGAAPAVQPTTSPSEQSASSGILGPILTLIAIATVAFFAFKGCASPTETPATTDVAAAKPAEAKPAEAPASGMLDLKLPSGETVHVATSGIESQLVAFIQDASKPVDKTTWFNFDRLTFESGKATLKPESGPQIEAMMKVLQAFPNVKLKTGGYTDNTGNEEVNMKLSQDRANTVKEALVAKGIAADRLEAEGYGSQHAVAPNDTEEGRAQNRRIACRVTAK